MVRKSLPITADVASSRKSPSCVMEPGIDATL